MSTLRDWLAYRLVMMLPTWAAHGIGWRFTLWLLPYAGSWAYRDEGGEP